MALSQYQNLDGTITISKFRWHCHNHQNLDGTITISKIGWHYHNIKI